MLSVLRSTEVDARPVAAATCIAIQRVVADSVAAGAAAPIRYFLPDRPTIPQHQIIAVSCLPVREESGRPIS